MPIDLYSSLFSSESLDLLIASLECSPPAVDQLPRLEGCSFLCWTHRAIVCWRAIFFFFGGGGGGGHS